MVMAGDRPSTDVVVTPEKVVEMARAQRAQIVDLRFTGLFGMWQHFSIPVRELTSELFEEGIGFDGSSIRGFQHIHESDLILMADAETAVIDPLSRVTTLLLTCDVYDPVNLVYSKRNRSAAVRIPVYSSSPRSVRVEYRPPDPSANPYLAFAAMTIAGLAGIRNKIDPGEPMDVDLYELPPSKAARVQQVPGSLDVALRALETNCKFLLDGDVFARDVIETWIETKRKKDVDFIRLRPNPSEFYLYFDV